MKKVKKQIKSILYVKKSLDNYNYADVNYSYMEV